MDALRRTLLVFGFVREICNNYKIQLLPDDLIKSLVIWLSFADRFDERLTHQEITIESIEDGQYGTYQRIDLDENADRRYRSAICEQIIKKGEEKTWTFKFDSHPTDTDALIGIIEDDIVQTEEPGSISDFSDLTEIGCAIYMRLNRIYNKILQTGQYFNYGNQFILEKNDMISMKLDLTQKVNKNGILSFVYHSKVKSGVDISKCSNIVDGKIDINKEYRAAVALYTPQRDAISLLPFVKE